MITALLRVGLAGLAASLCQAALADNIAFDSEMLRLRGIDPQMAAFLSEQPRFTAGLHAVDLMVNGQPQGRVTVRFDEQGALCFDATLIQAAGLLPIADPGCEVFLQRYPHTQVELVPQRGQVALLVPGEALQPQSADHSGFSRGGVAGLLNYDMQGLYNQFDDTTSRFWSANTETGFNAGDWIVRSRQLFSSSDGQTRSEHLEAYAQRSFVEQQALLQAGQINLYNPVLSGARVVGAQWMSEPALTQTWGQAAIEGIAATQARVEVYQNGTLLYTTVVPAGPFALGNIAQLDRRRDVQVTVIEADGARRSFTVLAATLGMDLPASGFAFGAGQVRDLGGLNAEPWVISAGWSQPLLRSASLSSGLLAADGYRAGGAGVALEPWLGGRLQGTLQSAHAQEEGVVGVQGSASLGQQFNDVWSGNLTLSRQSPGYRELSDTLLASDATLDSRYRQQYAVALGWSHPAVGSFNGGYSASDLYEGSGSGRAYLAWGKRVGRASLSVSAEWNVSGDAGLGNALYFTASLPLGERRRVRASVRTAGGQSRAGVGLQEQLSDTFSYRLGAERSAHASDTDLSLGASLLAPVAQFDVNHARYGQGNGSYSAAMRGGLVVHEGGITLSPYPLQDTFALLSVGDVAGVRVDTPGGLVWTDGSGQAVIAQVAPYGKSSVEVQARSLPRNVDLQQGAAVIQAGRGAVPRLSFATQVTRRVLLNAMLADGTPLPAGAMVSDEHGQLVTLVQDGGSVFVPDLTQSPRLQVKAAEHATCTLHFEVPAKADPTLYFETATAVCHALQGAEDEV